MEGGGGPSESRICAEVRSWVLKVPVGLGLCPWAIKSQSKGLLRIVTCESELSADGAEMLETEIELLLRDGAPPLSTTLLVCPYVDGWSEFQSFDNFVRFGIRDHFKKVDILERVTLVSFHPNFSRWHDLPDGIGVGSLVQAHYGMIGQKSEKSADATIIETNCKAFGLRKVKVRFHNNALKGLTHVPTDWIVVTNETCPRLLIDNIMHRSPYPTIHMIVNQDLASLCIRDVSRVKRLNAQRMAKIGWEGLTDILDIDVRNTNDGDGKSIASIHLN